MQNVCIDEDLLLTTIHFGDAHRGVGTFGKVRRLPSLTISYLPLPFPHLFAWRAM